MGQAAAHKPPDGTARRASGYISGQEKFFKKISCQPAQID